MRKAVIHTATGAVLRHGFCDFASDGSFKPATETQVDLNENSLPTAGVPLYHHKVDSGDFIEMSQGEKDAVDAAREAQLAAKLDGSARISRVVNSTAELPLPPPEKGLLVGVVQSGQVALAISGVDRWYLFAVDLVVGP